jgi:flagellar motor switch/type III secretory pathway protein FliN
MSTRSFKLVNRSESQRICDRLSVHVTHWSEQWLSGTSAAPDVLPQKDGGSFDRHAWTVRCNADGAGAAIGLPMNDSSIRQRLSGVSGLNMDDAVFTELEREAVSSLLTSLHTADENDIDRMPSSEAFDAPGSGYVLCLCRLRDVADFYVLLWPATVQAWLSDVTAKTSAKRVSVSRMDALDAQTVKIDVVAGEAEVAFEDFQSLSEGVVIKLDRRLDQPLLIRLVGDGVVCSGHLGFNEERRAIQVVSTDKS